MDQGKPSAARERVAVTDDEERARRMVRTWGLCSADVEDVTQEVLIALDARRTTFQPPENGEREQAWSAFVWGVVVRQVAAFRRERARLRRGDESARQPIEPIVPSTEDVMLAASPRVLLLRALGTLPPPQAAVMRLHVEGLSMPALAATLGIPYGTAWTRFRAARDEVGATLRRWAAERGAGQWR